MRHLISLLLAVCAGLAMAQPGPGGAGGYRNNYPHPGDASFVAWQWERLHERLPKPPPGGWNLPAVKTDPVALRAPGNNPSVTWVEHATMLVRLAGKNILFDPAFSERASPAWASRAWTNTTGGRKPERTRCISPSCRCSTGASAG